MRTKKQITKEEKRQVENQRKVKDRRTFNISYELLNYDKPDRRSVLNRRSGKDRRINSAKEE